MQQAVCLRRCYGDLSNLLVFDFFTGSIQRFSRLDVSVAGFVGCDFGSADHGVHSLVDIVIVGYSLKVMTFFDYNPAFCAFNLSAP